jgi:hypothetical protein
VEQLSALAANDIKVANINKKARILKIISWRRRDDIDSRTYVQEADSSIASRLNKATVNFKN